MFKMLFSSFRWSVSLFGLKHSHDLHDVAHFVLVGSSVQAVPGVEHVVQVGHLLSTHTTSGLVRRAPPPGGLHLRTVKTLTLSRVQMVF